MTRILTALAGCLVLSAASFSFFEDKSLWDAFWWANITGLTIGYGDLYPVTVGGRITAIIHGWASVILMALLTANVLGRLMDEREKFTHDEQEEILLHLRRLDPLEKQ